MKYLILTEENIPIIEFYAYSQDVAKTIIEDLKGHYGEDIKVKKIKIKVGER
jgi:hypothetical protein